MRLSTYFTLDEACFSETAIRLGINNIPNQEQFRAIQSSAYKLDILRDKVGYPIHISSWLRIPELNAKIPGSSKTSHHTTGFAIDCSASSMPVFNLCKLAEEVYKDIGFDQIIHEYGGWMHISFHPNNRRQTLTIFRNSKGYSYKSGILTKEQYLA